MIYMVVNKEQHAVKIGYTNNIERRMHEYKTHDPFVKMIDYFTTGDLKKDYAIEQLAHDEMDTMKKLTRISNTEWYIMDKKTYKKFTEKTFKKVKCLKACM